ncbi:zinc finger MYM-type protein 3-like isoform X1 [Haliotis rufescens]|uniref:zinc finger MYM-type protein 3-like isoform X1 n=1 Tax=Haliotis rufescens TaxID=6454 RepID=UPI00201EA225|nr:zinc finger MYM-type protein 3-like isoform X1 [Haliotis rufescens]
MADASDGHVQGDETISSPAHDEKEVSPVNIDEPSEVMELNNGTGNGPTTPAEPMEADSAEASPAIADEEQEPPGSPGSPRVATPREEDMEAEGDLSEAQNENEEGGDRTSDKVLDEAEEQDNLNGTEDPKASAEEEDEVVQIEVPEKRAQEESKEDAEPADDDLSQQDEDRLLGDDDDDQKGEDAEILSEGEGGGVITEKGPKTPATPLQDEMKETSADAPDLEAEAPELEEEAPILEPEEPTDQNATSAENSQDADENSEPESDANRGGKGLGTTEAMEVDDASNTETDKGGLETISEEAEETNEDSRDMVDQETSNQSGSEAADKVGSEKSPEPPVLDPETSIDSGKKGDSDIEIVDGTDSTKEGNTDKDGQKTDSKDDEDESKGEKSADASKMGKKNMEDDDDDVMVIEDEKTEPEAIVLDDDEDEGGVAEKSKGKGKDSSSLATMDSSNDMGLQISSVTSGADVSGLHIASVSGGGEPQDKESAAKTSAKEGQKTAPDSMKTRIKQERTTPPPAASGSPAAGKTSVAAATPSSGGKKSKMQSCIVCGKVGRCKYNIVRNGDIKHLCDDTCFRKFRANPTMFLKNTSSTQQKSPGQPTTRSQTGSLKQTAKSSNSQSEYKTCTVCQLMNINTQKPFVQWMNVDFCSKVCLAKYQSNLNSSCSYCTSFVAPEFRPLFCLQVGTDFKTFCSAKCSNEYKKRLRLCAFCQKDLATVSDSFCAPVDANKFLDFCSKNCLKKYEEKTSDVEIIGVESTGKKGGGQSNRCAVCAKGGQMKHNIKLNGVMNRLCSDPCLSAFQYANKLAMNTCDNCGGLCPTEDVVSHFIQFEGQQKRFCKDACVNFFRSKHKKIVACGWCGTKKVNFDMIERVDSNNKYQLFCSLNCLSLYRVNLQAKSNQAVTCDHCHKYVPAQYHLTMSDASVRNFCSYNCVMSFQSQFSANSKNSSQPTIHSQQRVQLQNKPNTRASSSNATSPGQGQSNSFPVISNVVSLAPQGAKGKLMLSGQKQQTVNIKSNTPVPVVVSQAGKQSVSTATQQQIIIQPPPPKQMKNKSLLCKPFVQTKATSCRPHTLNKEVQTEEHQGKPVLIPVPVPVYVPCPMAMYAAPTPQMVPVPIPIPVPIFIPTAKKTAEKILKLIKEIREKIPSDPLEAELLMMAEAVAGGGGDSDSDTDKSDADPFPAITNDKDDGDDVAPLIDRGAPGGGEEDLVQMALRMAEEITGPVLDLETSVEPVAVNTGPNTALTEASMPETKTSAATDSRHIVNMDTAENKSSVVDSEAQKTKKNTSWGVKIFKQWLGVRGKSPNFETHTPQELNRLLKVFYAEVRNTDGQYYTRSSYVGIRAAIHRHLRQPPFEREFNIRQDQEFFSANNVFIGMLKKIQKLGLDVTTHYEPISERDLVKIRAYQSVDDPVSLQRKVWFDLTLGFGRMGAENQHNLTRSSFNIEVDESGCEFITSAHSEVTKRHSGYLQDLNQQNTRIYATGTSSCPVASFKVYLSKLHPENTALFQRPRKHVNRSPDPHWYTAQALGHNNLSNMMKSISQRARLSKTYTNHCVRATTISLLSHAGVENREIMKITGHKNEQSLLMYNANLSSAQKRRYSNILQGGSVSTEVMLVGTIPPVNYPVSLEVNPL